MQYCDKNAVRLPYIVAMNFAFVVGVGIGVNSLKVVLLVCLLLYLKEVLYLISATYLKHIATL